MKLRTAASLEGILAGALTFLGAYLGGISRAGSCALDPCTVPGPNFYVMALAGLLVLNSLVSLVGPAVIFYASAGLSILLGASVVPNSSFGDPVVLGAVGLVVLAFALSLLAARRKSKVSEQANPMNLPVFG